MLWTRIVKETRRIPLIPFIRLQTYKYSFFENLNLKIVLKLTGKLSKMRNSSQNLDMFQYVSTYDTAYKIGHMYPMYTCKISWIFETGNFALVCMICRKVNFETEKYFKFKSLWYLASEWYPNDINWNLKHIHTRKLCMQCVNLICLKNKWETYLLLKTSVSIMQTKYEI